MSSEFTSQLPQGAIAEQDPIKLLAQNSEAAKQDAALQAFANSVSNKRPAEKIEMSGEQIKRRLVDSQRIGNVPNDKIPKPSEIPATEPPTLDEKIEALSNSLDTVLGSNPVRARLEYELRNAYDEKYQNIQQQLQQDPVSQQLRQNPDTAPIAQSIDLQIQFVLDSMRSPDIKNTKEIKAAYVERYQQLQDAKQKLYDLNNKVSQVAGQTDMERYYKSQMMETLQSVDGPNSVLVQAKKKYGDAVQDEQSMVGSALERFNFIQSIFSPNRSSMNGPENQMAYTIRNRDQRRGRRENEKAYDVSKLPLLMDTVTMAKEVFDTKKKDKRELFGKPYSEWTPEMKETYANYVENTYENEVEQMSKTLFSKDPSEMTPDELRQFSKYKDAYVVEQDHKHYLVTRDDPQWTDEDARQFARQIANEKGNEYYEPEPWEIALSWTVAALGLAFGVAALPLGATTAGLAAGVASAGLGIASMGFPPVGGPEWLHKLFTALSITTAGASLIQGGYAIASAVKAARATQSFNAFSRVGSEAVFLKNVEFVDDIVDASTVGSSVTVNRFPNTIGKGLGTYAAKNNLMQVSFVPETTVTSAVGSSSGIIDRTLEVVQYGRQLGSYVAGKLGSYFKPAVVSQSQNFIQMTDIITEPVEVTQQVSRFKNAFLSNPAADEIVVAMRQGGSVMTRSVKDSVVNSMNGTLLGRFSPFVGSFVEKLGDALLDTVVTKETVANAIATAQNSLVDAAVAGGVPNADILGEIIPDTAVAIGRYARNPALGADVIAETLGERIFRWASSDATTAKYALSKLYSGAGAAKDALLRIGSKIIGKAIAGSEVGKLAGQFVDALVATGTAGYIAKASHDLVTRELQDRITSFMEMTDDLKEVLGEEAINYAQDAIIDALADKISGNAQKLFENQTNGFGEAFTNATGYSLERVINDYAQGLKSSTSNDNNTEKSGKTIAMQALLRTVERALPESVRKLGLADLVSKALGNETLTGATEEILSKVKQQVYNASKDKSQAYMQDQFGTDVSTKLFEVINSLDVLYGDLPNDRVQEIQKSLLEEQFKFVMSSTKTQQTRFDSDVDERYFREVARNAYAENAPETVGPFSLAYESDTIKAYVDPSTKRVMLGIRGTADVRDVKAWVPTGVGLLKSTDRYTYDNEQLKSIFARYSPSEYTFYVAGHSLGGALSTQFKRDYPFIKNASVYNSATSPKDILDRGNTSVLRNYTANDALYNLQGGSLAADTVKGTKTKANTGIASLDTILDLYGLIEGHKMDNFFVDERRNPSYSY
jgi:hypothetical protein